MEIQRTLQLSIQYVTDEEWNKYKSCLGDVSEHSSFETGTIQIGTFANGLLITLYHEKKSCEKCGQFVK